MGKLIIGLVLGLVLGGLGATMLAGRFAGQAVGVGVATGLSAGICSVVEAAEQSGLLSVEQIEQVLTRAADNVRSVSSEDLPPSGELAGSVAACREVMAGLRAGR